MGAKIAGDLGIVESSLRRWMTAEDVEARWVEGVMSEERAEFVGLRRRKPGAEDGGRDFEASFSVLRPVERFLK